jgi:hypothetical protein
MDNGRSGPFRWALKGAVAQGQAAAGEKGVSHRQMMAKLRQQGNAG